MVEVLYQSWKRIIVHEKVEHDLDELAKIQSLGVEPGGLSEPLLWADGVVSSRSTMFETEDVIKDKLEGIVHWSSVEWALMPEFEGVIITKETNVKVPIINVSTHLIYRTVSKWLRKH